MSNTGTMISRPNGIALFQLLAARGAINLEKLGIKHSRGSVRKNWAVHFGMKPRAKADEVIARINQEIAAVTAKGDLGIETF